MPEDSPQYPTEPLTADERSKRNAQQIADLRKDLRALQSCLTQLADIPARGGRPRE